jgi:hypothetical protein
VWKRVEDTIHKGEEGTSHSRIALNEETYGEPCCRHLGTIHDGIALRCLLVHSSIRTRCDHCFCLHLQSRICVAIHPFLMPPSDSFHSCPPLYTSIFCLLFIVYYLLHYEIVKLRVLTFARTHTQSSFPFCIRSFY